MLQISGTDAIIYSSFFLAKGAHKANYNIHGHTQISFERTMIFQHLTIFVLIKLRALCVQQISSYTMKNQVDANGRYD